MRYIESYTFSKNREHQKFIMKQYTQLCRYKNKPFEYSINNRKFIVKDLEAWIKKIGVLENIIEDFVMQ